MMGTMKTIPLLILIALLCIVAGASWFFFFRPQEPVTPIDTTPTPTEATVSDHGQFYDIDATYPAKTPLTENDAAAVALMRTFIETSATEFKTQGNFAHMTPEEVSWYADGRKQALDITYKAYASAHTISYVFQIYADTLGAHPNTYYRTFTFDMTTGAPLELSALFTDGAPYLETLSTIARKELPPVLAERSNISVNEVDMEYLESGTLPVATNFQFFYLDGTTLVIIFPPYQIGPYVLGTQELRVPTGSIATILKPAYK